ncbi:class I SAM-dependent methyltransferase [Ciceribacter sp. RN22]|uniref:class I SAM-dependent methyltransferase n=1 Tax=Ciceribacter sp. RN22 TaxID=2954932 RepID=UPI0020936B36|nr:methyltransferase domain-containing protein [Ciceribacter sp. RN22]MCO6177444.1 methyltransferase domain-containing protein [Ciceribacter sp. RN22]
MNRPLHPSDHLLFFKSWLAKPFETAAIAPSSRRLAEAMTAQIEPRSRVLELGPGTGVFTRALVERGVAERDLLLVERNPVFARLLADRFPDALILTRDAATLPAEAGACDAAVSGLPLLSMPVPQVTRILKGAFRTLKPDAPLWQFTYGPRCPVPQPLLRRLGLRACHTRFVLLNLPPASVYRIERVG